MKKMTDYLKTKDQEGMATAMEEHAKAMAQAAKHAIVNYCTDEANGIDDEQCKIACMALSTILVAAGGIYATIKNGSKADLAMLLGTVEVVLCPEVAKLTDAVNDAVNDD